MYFVNSIRLVIFEELRLNRKLENWRKVKRVDMSNDIKS